MRYPSFLPRSVPLQSHKCLAIIASILIASQANAKAEPKVIVEGLKAHSSIAVGGDGKTYVTTMGESGKDGDGAVYMIEGNIPVSFATGLDDPRGIVTWSEWVFVIDKNRIIRINKDGKSEVFAAANAFPTEP